MVGRGISGFKLDYGEDVVAELGGRRVTMRLDGGELDASYWYRNLRCL